MFKLLRRYQKQILSVFGVLLMITFLKGLVPQGSQNRMTDTVVGNLNGVKVMRSELAEARNEWVTLKQLNYFDPNRPQDSMPFLEVAMGSAADIINNQKNQETFYLLVQEARQRGITVDPDDLQSIIRNNIGNMPSEGTDGREGAVQAVEDCLLVKQLLESSLSVVKISAPLREMSLQRIAQKVSINVISFSSDRFIDKVPKPTEMEIKNQFDSFSDRLPGEYGSANDPLGFGYKYLNRVKVQFIGLQLGEIQRVAEASKSAVDWDVAAFAEFQANRDQYDGELVPPATQPSPTAPLSVGVTTGPSTPSTPSTQPAVSNVPVPRKLDDITADFVLHAPLVLKKLHQDEAIQLERKVIRRISESLSTGYNMWHESHPDSAAPTTQPDADPYTSAAFINNLASAIQKEFGVTPITGNINELRSEVQLASIEGIGGAYQSFPNGQRIPFAHYAAQDPAPGNLSVWQPSEPLIVPMNPGSGDVYIFRISQFDAAHTPKLEEVRDQVVSDCKTAAAYKLALAAARTIQAEAQKLGIDAVANQAVDLGGSSLIKTDQFEPTTILESPNAGITIPPLNLKFQSVGYLAQSTQDLLGSGAKAKTVVVAELWPDAIASVIQVNQAVPLWTAANVGAFEAEIANFLVKPQAEKIMSDLLSYASTAMRLNFKPADSLTNPEGS